MNDIEEEASPTIKIMKEIEALRKQQELALRALQGAAFQTTDTETINKIGGRIDQIEEQSKGAFARLRERARLKKLLKSSGMTTAR